MTLDPIHIIGGGLAGSEAAWQIATMGVPVVIHEMRGTQGHQGTAAHKTDKLSELVCSNSFRSDDSTSNAVGVLHAEMRRLNSLIMHEADRNQVPAGGALAVDREGFSASVTEALDRHPLITVERVEIDGLPPASWDSVIVATGPLTAPGLAQSVLNLTGEDSLAFFDAIAPIVHFDSIDMDRAWFQSRYDKVGPGGTGKDYINCPLDEPGYNRFIDALVEADAHDFKQWEKDTPYFNGCLPIEVMARRGRETLRHGPMKPVGLTNPHNPHVKPHAVVQLRQDNAIGTLFNLVGFQTKIKYGAQADILRLLPGLEQAKFARLGGMHRNTYLNSPLLLDAQLRLKAQPRLRFAGQITGCEGYVESASIGLYAGRLAAAERLGQSLPTLPPTMALGALVHHITGGHVSEPEDVASNKPRSFQPMNINFGLFAPYTKPLVDSDGRRVKGKAKSLARKRAMARRALETCDCWISACQHAQQTAA